MGASQGELCVGKEATALLRQGQVVPQLARAWRKANSVQVAQEGVSVLPVVLVGNAHQGPHVMARGATMLTVSVWGVEEQVGENQMPQLMCVCMRVCAGRTVLLVAPCQRRRGSPWRAELGRSSTRSPRLCCQALSLGAGAAPHLWYAHVAVPAAQLVPARLHPSRGVSRGQHTAARQLAAVKVCVRGREQWLAATNKVCMMRHTTPSYVSSSVMHVG